MTTNLYYSLPALQVGLSTTSFRPLVTSAPPYRLFPAITFVARFLTCLFLLPSSETCANYLTYVTYNEAQVT